MASPVPKSGPRQPGGAEPAAVQAALAELAAVDPGRVWPGRPLGPLTTYRVGGAAAVAVTVRASEDLEAVAVAASASGLPVLVVGLGSNLLVADAGFGGIAVLLDPVAFGALEVQGSAVRAGGAMPLPALARRTAAAGLTGLEWAVGIPGSVGGGVRMNAGGHGSDIASCLISCGIADLGAGGALRRLSLEELEYRYRHSAVAASQVVLEAELRVERGDPEASRRRISEIVAWRRANQPGGQNAGSVFTNPPGVSAGYLIDTSGLKGRRLGSAMVSPKHANFIQADSGGSADDVYALIVEVRREVARSQGVWLEPEVRLVGFPPGLEEERSTSSGGRD